MKSKATAISLMLAVSFIFASGCKTLPHKEHVGQNRRYEKDKMDNVVEYEAKWIAGLNQGDVSVADVVFDFDCKFHITGSQKPLSLAEFKEQVQKDLFDFPGRRFFIEDQIKDQNIAPDRYVFRWSAESTYSISPKEEPIRIEGLIIDRVANGKIVERWEEWDQPALDAFKGRAMYKKYFGEGNKEELVGLRKFTINHLFANIWSRKEHLSMPERSMITLSLLAALGRNEELKRHLKGALNSGLTPEKILETMIHVAHYAGWPAGHNGERIANEVFEEIKPENIERTFLFCMLVKDGQVEEFDRWLDDHVRVTNNIDVGCIAFEKFKGIKSDRIFVLYEKWQNQAFLDKHLERMTNEGRTAKMLKFLDDTRTFDISNWQK